MTTTTRTPDETRRIDPRLRDLILLAVAFSAGHHIDHLIRGNQVGWPVTGEVNAFTYSLAIYPVILIGWLLYRSGRVGPGFWLFLSGGGVLFLTAIHFGPWAVEPPSAIIEPYDSALLGWVAMIWLLAFIAVLLITSGYEWRLWRKTTQAREDGTIESGARS